MLKIYVTAYLNEDLSVQKLLERSFTSIEEAKQSFRPEANEDWVRETSRILVDRGGWPLAAIIEVDLQGFSPAAESEEGVLRHDFDDGWVLDGHGPNAGVRICDLFPELDGKRVRVRVEVLEDTPKGQER